MAGNSTTSERGLPPIPRDIDRALYTYLRVLENTVLRLSSQLRNSDTTRAVRTEEAAKEKVVRRTK